MTAAKTVKLTHPEASGSIEVRKDVEEYYRSQGWTDPAKK